VPANFGLLGVTLSSVSLISLIVWLVLFGRRLFQLATTSSQWNPNAGVLS